MGKKQEKRREKVSLPQAQASDRTDGGFLEIKNQTSSKNRINTVEREREIEISSQKVGCLEVVVGKNLWRLEKIT